VKFILDHNLSPHLARGLGHLVLPYGDAVTCLKDLGMEEAADDVWIPRLASAGWIAITCDLDIVRNPYRQQVFRTAKLTAFFLLEAWSKGSVTRGPEIASRLLKLWPEITRLAQTSLPGTCFAVPFKGTIRRFSPQGKRPI
jgi:PIN domain-containing protein